MKAEASLLCLLDNYGLSCSCRIVWRILYEPSPVTVIGAFCRISIGYGVCLAKV
jgi:hypothetical protein